MIDDVESELKIEDIELKIGNDEPFVPDLLIEAKCEHGFVEKTKPEDEIRNFAPSSQVTSIHYIRDGLEIKEYYRYSKYEWGEARDVRLHVWGLLND